MNVIDAETLPVRENWARARLCLEDYSEYVTGLTLIAFSELIRDLAVSSNRDAECILQKYFLKALAYWTFLSDEERQKKIEPFLLDLETELFN